MLSKEGSFPGVDNMKNSWFLPWFTGESLGDALDLGLAWMVHLRFVALCRMERMYRILLVVLRD